MMIILLTYKMLSLRQTVLSFNLYYNPIWSWEKWAMRSGEVQQFTWGHTERAEQWFEAGKCSSRIWDFSCHILTQCSSQLVSFSPRQLLDIRSPRWGSSCYSLPFRKDCKTYPGWKGLEMHKSTFLARACQMSSHHWTASSQESARSVWPWPRRGANGYTCPSAL